MTIQIALIVIHTEKENSLIEQQLFSMIKNPMRRVFQLERPRPCLKSSSFLRSTNGRSSFSRF
ncbi:unnamed protein product [Oikopleura dioica]|uniref:Uncharacterized protein n=1 Tax=Oikopleura dioica TaxID=34765 RepID=E4Y2H1_OIKDI|nr:unnamed protein product [Oikopleura dioica]